MTINPTGSAGPGPDGPATSPGRPGRKPDPRIAPAVLAAALRVYARDGWSALSFESAAKESGVGKPAIYRRWSSPAELLANAFDALVKLPQAEDRGSLRADLTDYVAAFVHWFGDQQNVMITARLAVDRLIDPELEAAYYRIVHQPRLDAARQIGRRALARGELKSAADSFIAAELLVGAMTTHWQFSRPSQLERFRETLPTYGERIVEIVLAGLTHATVVDTS
ncbi:TetR/AcrR family transcriptional regulator [Gordonia sp. VNK21]|uniref:TetR/AcrR family transcriptional regulator n=1 Tax=Gordonia sp. VNK21 TaxID=3382483 RepID=UPI0038D424FC